MHFGKQYIRLTFSIYKFLLPLALFIASGHHLSAQLPGFYLNVDNGMPTNHIYSTITDRNGYLWIATDNGVIRYNGYELKTFSTKDGLPNADVWQLVEDQQGRIWLCSIANEIGYIKNEQYYSAKWNKQDRNTIYPTFFSRRGKNVVFSSAFRNDNSQPSLCAEKNDTITPYNIAAPLKQIYPELQLINKGHIAGGYNLFIDKNSGNSIVFFDDVLYDVTIQDNKLSLSQKASLPKGSVNILNLGNNHYYLLGKYLFVTQYNKKETYIYVVALSGKLIKYDLSQYLSNEPILSLLLNGSDIADKNIYAVSNNHIVQISVSDTFYVKKVFDIKDVLPGINGDNINSFTQDNRWGTNIATSDNGIFISLTGKNSFKKYPVSLKKNKFINGDDGEGFWINYEKNKFCRINKDVHYYEVNGIAKITSVKKIRDEQYIVLGSDSYILNTKSAKWTRVPSTAWWGSPPINYLLRDDSILYSIDYHLFQRVNRRSPQLNHKAIDVSRYSNMIYDSLRNRIWVYNQNKLLIYDPATEQENTYEEKQLKRFGLQNVNKICIDNKYGNIFLKGDTSLSMYNYETNNFQLLFPHLNLNDCNIDIYKNILVVYGRFGITFTKILGPQKLSAPVTCYNIKNSLYNHIDGVQLSNDKAIINTDKETYIVDIPMADSIYSSSSQQNDIDYRFVYYYTDKVSNLHDGDTLLIDAKNITLRFDAINPYGDGRLSFNVSYNGSAHYLNGQEFTIPSTLQTSDNYYDLTISASDKNWKSKPLHFIIYIQPKWYQTKSMVKILWLSAILTFLALITLSVLITRRLVLNATRKRQLRMELELKSIYAQINPHFIFNSLNSALLLVSKGNMNDAYTHITKFSRLLRSYIKSSRNKFVLLADEINNLKNYIDLQQVRFKNKFDYELVTDTQIDPSNTHIPALLLQPFVENAIEHGLLSKEEKGHLKVHFKKDPLSSAILCIIDDDGIGRQESKLNKIPNPIKDESYGELLIKDLVNIFNKYEHMNIHVSYADKQAPLTGTTVTIKINIKK